MPDDVLAAAFEQDLRDILIKERALGLSSTRFAQMLDEHGGVQTAHLLLEPSRQPPPNTFTFLRKNNRPDLTLEYYVIMPKYESLFTAQEREIAAFRLLNES